MVFELKMEDLTLRLLWPFLAFVLGNWCIDANKLQYVICFFILFRDKWVHGHVVFVLIPMVSHGVALQLDQLLITHLRIGIENLSICKGGSSYCQFKV